MSLTVQLSELRTRSFDRAYVPSTGGPVSTSECDTQINTQYRRFYRRIAVKVPRLFSTDQTITTVSGTMAYAKPSDWMMTTAVFSQEFTDQLRQLPNVGDGERLMYRSPQGVYTVIHRYVPTPATLSGGTDTIDGICGLDEMVVLAVARYIRSKQQLDTSDIAAELAELEADVRRYDADDGTAQFVQDVANMDRRPYPYRMQVDGYALRGGYVDLFSATPGWP